MKEHTTPRGLGLDNDSRRQTVALFRSISRRTDALLFFDTYPVEYTRLGAHESAFLLRLAKVKAGGPWLRGSFFLLCSPLLVLFIAETAWSACIGTFPTFLHLISPKEFFFFLVGASGLRRSVESLPFPRYKCIPRAEFERETQSHTAMSVKKILVCI